MFTFLRTVDIFPLTDQQSGSDHEGSEDESGSNENISESLNLFVRNKTSRVKKTSKNKGGRKAQWSQSLLGDLVDILISSDYYKKKLIFTNTNNQKKWSNL